MAFFYTTTEVHLDDVSLLLPWGPSWNPPIAIQPAQHLRFQWRPAAKKKNYRVKYNCFNLKNYLSSCHFCSCKSPWFELGAHALQTWHLLLMWGLKAPISTGSNWNSFFFSLCRFELHSVQWEVGERRRAIPLLVFLSQKAPVSRRGHHVPV